VLAHAAELEACGSVPGTGLIPPISAGLAVGEQRGASGQDLLAALVAGIEVQGRLGTAAIGACDRGFMGFSLVGPAGAAVTAGKLLNLDRAQLRRCLGIALPLAGGSTRGEGYMTHVHEAGVPARTGVWAAQLADRGFTGSPDYLDGHHSWGEQFAGGGLRPYEPDAITAGLGGPLFIEQSDVGPKKYGTSGVCAQAIDGVIELMERHGLTTADIATVELVVPPFAKRIAPFTDPIDGEQAKFCLEQAIAGILVRGVPSLPYVHAFTDEAATDSRYQQARSKVKVAVDTSVPDLRGFASQKVALMLNDGRRFDAVVERRAADGRLRGALDLDRRLEMFRQTCSTIDPKLTERIVEIVMALEEHTVAELAEVLVST
jgi:2-methylcitrate dehydratase PrpD